MGSLLCGTPWCEPIDACFSFPFFSIVPPSPFYDYVSDATILLQVRQILGATDLVHGDPN